MAEAGHRARRPCGEFIEQADAAEAAEYRYVDPDARCATATDVGGVSDFTPTANGQAYTISTTCSSVTLTPETTG